MGKKELLWINLLKAICIICDFYVHCQTYYGVGVKGVSTYIHPIYVNSFFFAFGYLLYRKQLLSFITPSSFVSTQLLPRHFA